MNLKPASNNLNNYLKSSHIIDYDQPEIQALADELKTGSATGPELVKNIYEFVRDEINHSGDIKGQAITCKASEVLKAREGLCYAKSHLLAALLRYHGIPCGFCYQLLNSGATNNLVLHGLNAVYFEDLNRWVRLDPRGNKQGLNAQFSLDNEQLAYQPQADKGEQDILINFAEPDSSVIYALTIRQSFDALWANLPAVLNRKW